MAALVSEAAPLAASNGPPEDRIVAVRFLGLYDANTAREAFPKLLDARQPSAVQLAVLQAFSGFLDGDVARQIITHWKSMSPSVRREAVEVLLVARKASKPWSQPPSPEQCRLPKSTRRAGSQYKRSRELGPASPGGDDPRRGDRLP